MALSCCGTKLTVCLDEHTGVKSEFHCVQPNLSAELSFLIFIGDNRVLNSQFEEAFFNKSRSSNCFPAKHLGVGLDCNVFNGWLPALCAVQFLFTKIDEGVEIVVFIESIAEEG